MNKPLNFKSSFLLAAMLVLPAAYAGSMNKADYTAGKTRIGADFDAAKTACASLAGNAKDICVEEGKAKEKIALAELEAGYTGKASDRSNVLTVRAEAGYAVAKERCDDFAGNVKDVCVQEAKAAETKALADAKLGKEIGKAGTEAAQTKRDADYKVAAEKCDAMAGEAQANCMASAKATYGKT